MPSGPPTVVASGVSAANTALDSGIVPVHLTTGILLVILTAGAASVSTFTITDDLGRVLLTGSFPAGATQQAIALGDAEGAPVWAQWQIGGQPVASAVAAVGAIPGGKGARRPLSLRVQIQALGVGITSGYAIVAE